MKSVVPDLETDFKIFRIFFGIILLLIIFITMAGVFGLFGIKQSIDEGVDWSSWDKKSQCYDAGCYDGCTINAYNKEEHIWCKNYCLNEDERG